MGKLLMVLMLLCTPVFAQTTPPLVPTPIEPPPCYPLINGTHAGVPRHVNGEVGQHVFWFCVVRNQAQQAGFSCLHGQCAASVLAAAQQTIIKATAKVRTANELYVEHIKFECGPFEQAQVGPRGDLCRERVNIHNAMVHQWLGVPK